MQLIREVFGLSGIGSRHPECPLGGADMMINVSGTWRYFFEITDHIGYIGLTTMHKLKLALSLFVCLYTGILGAEGVGAAPLNNEDNLRNGLSLYINTQEGGDISDRRLNDLRDYFNKSRCNIQKVTAGDKLVVASAADIVFMPLNQDVTTPFQKVFNLGVVGDQPLSGSLLVRSSTGIRDITDLADVRIAFISPGSVTGFHLQEALLDDAGVVLQKDLVTFTRSHLGAMSLLLHKDVFAAGVATPLANKWAKANDLTIVAESQSVVAGGLWMKSTIADEQREYCKTSFKTLFENKSDRKIKSLAKIFPAWMAGFIPTQE